MHLPSIRSSLLPKPKQENRPAYDALDPRSGPTLAPILPAALKSAQKAFKSPKGPALEPKFPLALQSTPDDFVRAQMPTPTSKFASGNPQPWRTFDNEKGFTYTSMFPLDDTLAEDMRKVVNIKGTTTHMPHCDQEKCRLPTSCDVAYNPYNDPCCICRDDDTKRAKAYQPYKSPFHRERNLSQVAKKRKLSHDDESSDGGSSDKSLPVTEPSAPFSEKSWLAMELFIIIMWTNMDDSSIIIVDALLRIMPDLDLDECSAMDMLRVTSPVANIYDEDEEDESTERARLRKLHEKVWHMPPENLLRRMNELYYRLLQLGYKLDHVVAPTRKDCNEAEDFVTMIDEPDYNYILLFDDGRKPWPITARFTEEDMDPGHLQEIIREHQESEDRKLKKRNDARNAYLDRLEWDRIRTEAAKEAIRMVRELEMGGRTNSRIQVEGAKLQIQGEGKIWPWLFSSTIYPAEIEPEHFASWVDNLSDRKFKYALIAIQDWAIAGIKIHNDLNPYGITSMASSHAPVLYNPLTSVDEELSPKRTFSAIWASEDEEIPSNSPPSYEDEPIEKYMTYEEVDELNKRQVEWVMEMSSNSELGPFPMAKVAEEIKARRVVRNDSLRTDALNSSVYHGHQVPRPAVEKSPLRADIAIGGLDGADDIPGLTLLAKALGTEFAKSLDYKARSRSPPPYPYPKPAVKSQDLLAQGPFRRTSNRNRAKKLTKTRLEQSVGPPLPSIEDNEETGRKHVPKDNKVFFVDGRFQSAAVNKNDASNLAKTKTEQVDSAVSVHVEEVDGVEDADPRDKSPPSQKQTQQKKPTIHDLELLVLNLQKKTWLKEDEEYRRIIGSEQSLGWQVVQGDIPYSHRSPAVMSTIIRDEAARQAWLERARHKPHNGLPLLSRSAPDSASSSSSLDSMSSCASSEHEGDDGHRASHLAIAAAATSRPSIPAGASGLSGVNHGSPPEPFPEHIEDSAVAKAQMPVANMTSSCGTAIGECFVAESGKNAVTEDAEIRFRETLSEVRVAFAEVDVVPESPSVSGDGEKVPNFDLLELSPDDFAKEA